MARRSAVCVGLAGQTAIVAVLALCGTAAPLTWEPGATGLGKLALPVAHADSGRGGGDDGGGGSGSGRSGGGDDSGSGDGSGSGSGSDSSGDNSGSGNASDHDSSSSGGSGSNDDGGDSSGHGSGTSGSDDRGDDDSAGHSGSGRRGDGTGTTGGDRDRPSVAVDLSDRELDAVLRGERVLVDDRGRVLEVEIEIEHGVRTVTAKPHGGDFARNPGPIGDVKAVDAGRTASSQVVVDPRNGALEVEIEHGVAVAKPHGGKGQAAVRGPVQVGSDLTPAEEAALIQGGWQ